MSIDTLNARLMHMGGGRLGRIKQQKLNSFHAALREDYNSRRIILPTGRCGQVLINTNNLKPDYDKKIVSADFRLGLKPGDVFECADDGTHWMVYLQDLVEIAYFKSEIIKCRYQLNVNGKDYWVYFQGPTETTTPWNIKRGINWNDLNLSGTVFIERNEETIAAFNRFTKIKLDNRTWEVKVVDSITVPGIIELEVREYFESYVDGKLEPEEEIIQESEISGKHKVYPYDICEYTINRTDGAFMLSNGSVGLAEIISQEDGRCTVEIISSRRGNFTLSYVTDDNIYDLDITILSL